MTIRSLLSATLVAILAATAARAVPIIDGKADVDYGVALSTQNTNTQFGNTDVGDVIATNNGGSELDQIFAKVVGDRLYVLAAGNLQGNFNKLEVFIDSKAGGSQTVVGASVPDQVDGYCCSGNSPGDGALQRFDGFKFDAGFAPDYYVTASHGGESVDGGPSFWALTAHYADLSKGQGDPTGRVSAGMQLGPQGKPVVLRPPFSADFDNNAIVDGRDALIFQQGLGSGTTRTTGDATGDGFVTTLDLDSLETDFAQVRTLATVDFYVPNPSIPTSALIGPTLPDLQQGDLIDKNYTTAHSPGGVPIAPELTFADAAHRDMDNSSLGLKLALDNSNAAGVSGDGGGLGDYTTPTAGDPAAVTTGIEFSIPLSKIGNPAALSEIKLTVFINGGSHDYGSNQFGGAGILRGNLGSDMAVPPNGLGNVGGIDLTLLAGNQFVSLQVPVAVAASGAIPEPATVVLLGAGLAGLARRRL